MIKSFDHVAITVKDFDKTIDWYVNNMGFTIQRMVENKERGTRLVFLEAGGLRNAGVLRLHGPQHDG